MAVADHASITLTCDSCGLSEDHPQQGDGRHYWQIPPGWRVMRVTAPGPEAVFALCWECARLLFVEHDGLPIRRLRPEVSDGLV